MKLRIIRTLLVAFMLGFAVMLGACGNSAAITIRDGGQVYVVTDADGKSLGEILDMLGIVINEGDEVSADLSSRMDTSAVIEISRECKVRVLIDGREQELILSGARVLDVLNVCGIQKNDDIVINFNDDEYLTDGMVITVNDIKHAVQETTEYVQIFAGDMDGDPENWIVIPRVVEEETTEAWTA